MASNVVDILRKIREGSLDPKEISIPDRRVCVAYLRLEGYTQEDIAEIFKISRQTIIRDEKANRREVAKLVDEIDVKTIAGGLIISASHLAAKALREKDYGLAWRIKTELIGKLQSLGYLPRSPEQFNLQIGTFVDLVQLAIKKVDSKAVEPESDSKNALPDPQEETTNDDIVAC